MTRRTPLSPGDFAAAVADYSRGGIDERHVRLQYEHQLTLARYTDTARDPLDPSEFVAALTVNAGLDVTEPDRDRVKEVYAEQLDAVRQRAGDSRV